MHERDGRVVAEARNHALNHASLRCQAQQSTGSWNGWEAWQDSGQYGGSCSTAEVAVCQAWHSLPCGCSDVEDGGVVEHQGGICCGLVVVSVLQVCGV